MDGQNEIQFDQNAMCDRCGRYGAYELDGRRLCLDCYQTFGSCCPEFGAEDQTGEKRP